MQLALVFALVLLAQGTTPNASTEALALLSNVSNRYAQAKSYHIEAVEERTFRNDFERSWQKTLLTAVVAPEGRYRYEGHTGHGWALLVSDGNTNWNYHFNERLYTKRAASAPDPNTSRIILPEESAVFEAKRLLQQVGALSKRLKTAALLPDETIVVNGHSVECNVVRFSDADLKTRNPNLKSEETIWIDKSRNVVVKTSTRTDSYTILAGSRARVPMVMEATTVYSVVEFDQQEPENSFAFSPPSDAKLVEVFPDPFAGKPRLRAGRADEFLGKPAPELQFKSADGKLTNLSSLRGKPIFIEYWATWCAPCVELVPDLKKLYAETVSGGLVWISIDDDEDPDAAAMFVSRERISWPNYHDDDGSLGKAFGREGVPLGVLIDAAGKVTFWGLGYEMPELRAAIAKLGPQFSAVVKSK